jgi:hypothetical protein
LCLIALFISSLYLYIILLAWSNSLGSFFKALLASLRWDNSFYFSSIGFSMSNNNSSHDLHSPNLSFNSFNVFVFVTSKNFSVSTNCFSDVHLELTLSLISVTILLMSRVFFMLNSLILSRRIFCNFYVSSLNVWFKLLVSTSIIFILICPGY